MDVSEAIDADIAGIAEFFTSAWAEAGAGAAGWTGASDDVIDQITAPEALRARIGGPRRRMYLARDDGRVIGFAATLCKDEQTIELAGIVVLDSMTGRGVGQHLLDAAVREAKASGYRSMSVDTEADNDRAIGFYERHGFTVDTTTTRDVEGTTVRLVHLSKDI